LACVGWSRYGLPVSPVLLVALILLGVVLVQAVIWLPVLINRRRAVAEASAALLAEIASAQSGEAVIRGPARARVRRGHDEMRGALLLTDARLLFAGGGRMEIALTDISLVKSSTWFNGAARAGFEWLILSTESQGDVGFLILDADPKWPNAVREALPQRNSTLPRA